MVKKQQAKRVQQVKKRKPSKIVAATTRVASLLWKPVVIAPIVLLVVMSVGYQKMQQTVIWPVESVAIEGEFHFIDKDELKQKVEPSIKGGLMSIDLEVIRSELVGMPWVDNVSVRRQWPDQIMIQVVEKQPVVYWGSSSLLSDKGELFTPGNTLDMNLPKLTGPDGQHRMMLSELSRMQAWLMETGLRIESMSLDARRSWTLGLSGDIELRLGRKEMQERLNRFVSIYKSNLQNEKREIKHIDMRYTNGFAVAWKEA